MDACIRELESLGMYKRRSRGMANRRFDIPALTLPSAFQALASVSLKAWGCICDALTSLSDASLFLMISRRLFFLIRQPPAFPYRLQYSIIGRLGLNHRVRDENGCFP